MFKKSTNFSFVENVLNNMFAFIGSENNMIDESNSRPKTFSFRKTKLREHH